MRTPTWFLIFTCLSVGCTRATPEVKATPEPPAAPVAAPVSAPIPMLVRAHEVAAAKVSYVYASAKAQSPSQQLGPLWVLPTHNEVWHIHGGDSAWVYRLSWALQSDVDRAVVVEVLSVELLIGHCVRPGWFSRTPMELKKIEWAADRSAQAAKTQGAKHSIAANQAVYGEISYKPVSVYNACERFAYGLKLLVDGAPQTLEVPLRVVREEPYDEDL